MIIRDKYYNAILSKNKIFSYKFEMPGSYWEHHGVMAILIANIRRK